MKRERETKKHYEQTKMIKEENSKYRVSLLTF